MLFCTMDRAAFETFRQSSTRLGSWESPWFRLNKPGHTHETLNIPNPACGRETAVYMILARISGDMDATEGVAVLQALESLVVEDTASEHYGCMRWFDEETKVGDTNAAFFTLMPYLVLKAVSPESLSEAEWDQVTGICRACLPWFVKEGKEPHWYYPNKVISDVAILWGVAHALGESEWMDLASSFAEDWIRYTRERGWGWGENMSLGYIPVILVAFRYLILSGEGQSWQQDFLELEEELLEMARFCDGKECVPSIRSYNFSGGEEYGSVLQWVIGNPAYPDDYIVTASELPWKSMLMLLLYEEKRQSLSYEKPPLPRERCTPVFDGHVAFSWAGDGIRLGSCSRFPVMPGHYQHRVWGLGWQSFPVSALLEGLGVARLQWRTEREGAVNTHPTSGANGIYRNYRIIGNNDLAEVVTRSAQEGPLAVVIRSIRYAVMEEGPALADEWWIPNGAGKVRSEGDWWILEHDGYAFAIRPCAVYRGEGRLLESVPAELVEQDGDACLRLTLLKESAALQVHERLEAAWLLRAFSREEAPDLRKVLQGIRVKDLLLGGHVLPREGYSYHRRLEVEEAGKRLELNMDFHQHFFGS